jgi:PPP family 3-phenylpropionic acid transporter
VGVFTGAGVVVRIVAGLAIPLLADRLGARRQVMAGIAVLGAAVFTLHPLIEDRTLLLLATMATGLVYPGMIPIADALTSAAGRAHGFAYGQARAWGSLTFLVANLGVGALIAEFGVDVARLWIVVCLAASVLFALTHPGGGFISPGARPGLRDAVSLVRKPVFAVFLLAIGFAEASHAVYYAYGSIHWQSLGLGAAEIGLLWAFPVGLEVVLMFAFGSVIVARLGPVGAIALSGAAGILRWGIMMTDPTGVILWAAQALHIITYAVGHLGAIAFLAVAVEERLASTAQGLFGAAFGGLLTACAMAVSAQIYTGAGGMTFALAATMSAIGLAAALLLLRLWRGGEI